MANRDKNGQEFHDEMVQHVARIRFPYPDTEHPNWKTYTNHLGKEMGIRDNNNLYYPDIVVVNTQTDRIFMSGKSKPRTR